MKKCWLLALFGLFGLSLSAFGQKKVKSGIIYSEHPCIEVMRRYAVLYEKQDTAALGKLFADSARIYGMARYDVDTSRTAQWSVPPSRSVTSAKAALQKVFDNWENIKMKPIGVPDGLEYNNSRFTVQSWWLVSLTNKKTKKLARVELVLFDIFNPDGKIAVQVAFYDPGSLLIAMKPGGQ